MFISTSKLYVLLLSLLTLCLSQRIDSFLNWIKFNECLNLSHSWGPPWWHTCIVQYRVDLIRPEKKNISVSTHSDGLILSIWTMDRSQSVPKEWSHGFTLWKRTLVQMDRQNQSICSGRKMAFSGRIRSTVLDNPVILVLNPLASKDLL